jgi:hypothetical protein
MEGLEDYVNSLSADTQKYLIDYTKSDYYEKLNKRLRKNQAFNENQSQMVKHIDMAFRFAPVLKNPIVVYRGVKRSYDPTLISYISTTLDINHALSFSGTICCLLKILIPAGSKVLPLYTISTIPQEEEILIDRTGKYTITSISEPFDGPKIYDIMYIPPVTQLIDTIQIKEIKKYDIDFYVRRLLDNVDEEELELLGPDIIHIIAASMENIPQEAIDIAIKKLS